MYVKVKDESSYTLGATPDGVSRLLLLMQLFSHVLPLKTMAVSCLANAPICPIFCGWSLSLCERGGGTLFSHDGYHARSTVLLLLIINQLSQIIISAENLFVAGHISYILTDNLRNR